MLKSSILRMDCRVSRWNGQTKGKFPVSRATFVLVLVTRNSPNLDRRCASRRCFMMHLNMSLLYDHAIQICAGWDISGHRKPSRRVVHIRFVYQPVTRHHKPHHQTRRSNGSVARSHTAWFFGGRCQKRYSSGHAIRLTLAPGQRHRKSS